jgi:hypothetical protein
MHIHAKYNLCAVKIFEISLLLLAGHPCALPHWMLSWVSLVQKIPHIFWYSD